jgi:hypothetical protein
VRAGAQVDEIAVLVKRDLLALGDGVSPRSPNSFSASARETTLRSNGRFCATIFAISASILSMSSGANGSVSKS